MIGFLGGAMLAGSAALMLADRAPRLIKRILGAFGRRLSERIDAGGSVRLQLDKSRADGDWIVHLGLWSIAVVLLALAFWSWQGLWISAIVVFEFSVAVELGQGMFSTTRTVELSDVVFNAIGVGLGMLAAWGIYLLWDRIARSRGRKETP